jgi:septal ring factor EnvC (AmiA/AmiB activator)
MSIARQTAMVHFWQQLEQLHAIRKRRAQRTLREAQHQLRQVQAQIAQTHDEIAQCHHMLQQAHAQFVANMIDMGLRSVGRFEQITAINRDRNTLTSSIAPLEEQLAQVRQAAAQVRQRIRVAEQRGQHASDQLRTSRRKLRDLQDEPEN